MVSLFVWCMMYRLWWDTEWKNTFNMIISDPYRCMKPFQYHHYLLFLAQSSSILNVIHYPLPFISKFHLKHHSFLNLILCPSASTINNQIQMKNDEVRNEKFKSLKSQIWVPKPYVRLQAGYPDPLSTSKGFRIISSFISNLVIWSSMQHDLGHDIGNYRQQTTHNRQQWCKCHKQSLFCSYQFQKKIQRKKYPQDR